MNKRLGVKRLRKIWDDTSDAYKRVRDQHLDEVFPNRMWSEGPDYVGTEEQAREWEAKRGDPAIREEIGRRYLEELCKLPTDILEDVVKANACGAQRRAPLTIEALTNELARRGLLGDSQECPPTKFSSN